MISINNWEDEFRHRLNKFGNVLSTKGDGIIVSIKIRVISGCYHRSCSPNAYRIIDDYFQLYFPLDIQLSFLEHESGPELLVYLALGTAGVTLTKSVIDLVTTIIKARSEGIKCGDRPSAPIELIVRGFDKNGKLWEEKILKFNSKDEVDRELIEKALQDKVAK